MMSLRRRVRAPIPFALSFLAMFAAAACAQAPATVGIPGNYQTEAGCAGDWDPACPATQLVYDANGDIWKNTFSINPAGGYEYKVALNGSWDVNYGLHALQNGPNIPLATTTSPQGVTFYYDHKTHWVTDNVNSIIATVPGSYHAPRCMLEFWVDPESPYHKKIFADEGKEFVLFCGAGWRSALAAKTLQDMGMANVAHIDGGFTAEEVFDVSDESLRAFKKKALASLRDSGG